MNRFHLPRSSKPVAMMGFVSSVLASALLAGCTSAPGIARTNSNGINAGMVTVPILITDAPSDPLIAFTLTLNKIVLIDAAGKTTSILAKPVNIEACHLSGVQENLVTARIPEGTYTSAVITFSDPQITYVDDTGRPAAAAPILRTTSYTAAFATPIAIGHSANSLLFDLLASQSVAIHGPTVTVNPTFTVKSVPTTPKA